MSTAPLANGPSIATRLTNFYARHDPNKFPDDIAEVVGFAQTSGVAVTNTKLQAKYGEDLDAPALKPVFQRVRELCANTTAPPDLVEDVAWTAVYEKVPLASIDPAWINATLARPRVVVATPVAMTMAREAPAPVPAQPQQTQVVVMIHQGNNTKKDEGCCKNFLACIGCLAVCECCCHCLCCGLC